MYNKIASLILNSAKASGLSDVYVAQPDSLKENLAGKIFVLGEIAGKKNEARRIFDFIIERLEDNYYNDEKILLRGKIEGLKVENIFEAALAKTNSDLNEFFAEEKIKLNPASSLTIGVIFENNLHFSSFGKNRALLVYARQEQHEIINVEANAETAQAGRLAAERGATPSVPLFSSVISGEIPFNSYFIFASESLPEYLSAKDMLAIVTKLPPIVAVEQIKNTLAKINAYVPFLAIVIKNTAGLGLSEAKEEEVAAVSAHGSISSLNYTEQKTEMMLSPAGLINFSKLGKGLKRVAGYLKPEPKVVKKKKSYAPEKESPAPPLELGQIKSLKSSLSDSLMLQEKIFFKKKGLPFGPEISRFFRSSLFFFRPSFWSKLLAKTKESLRNFNLKNRWLMKVLIAAVIILALSILATRWHQKNQAAQEAFTAQVAQIEEKENLIDSHLLYNDRAGAQTLLAEAQALLASLPHKSTAAQNTYNRLLAKLTEQQEKVEKIVKANASGQIADFSGLGVTNLAFANGRLYAASAATIYSLVPGAASTSQWTVAGAGNLSNPFSDGKGLIYYWDNNRLVSFDYKTGSTTLLGISSLDTQAGLTSFKIYNSNLYLVAKAKNQIYLSRYASAQKNFGAASNWLKETADLSQAKDFAIDGSIYILKENGAVLKFYKGKAADYKSLALSPAISNASKIIAGTSYLYVFDPSAKRLAVLAKKDGTLVNQYQVDSLAQPRDVAIDEAGRAAYFLDGEKVFKIGLNQ